MKFRILCCRIHIELSGCKALFLFELAAATAPVLAGESLGEQIGIAHALRLLLCRPTRHTCGQHRPMGVNLFRNGQLH